jgi:hypothetical protein
MTALDPGDFAHDDELRHAAGSDFGEGTDEAQAMADDDTAAHEVAVVTDLGEQPTADDEAEGCAAGKHPEHARRLVEVTDAQGNDTHEQVCSLCWQVVPTSAGVPAIIPKDRPGTDPTMRLGGSDLGPGGLRHMQYDPTAPAKHPDGSIAQRPYTPDEVERELVDTMWRLEAGAGWLTTKEEERGAAKLAYELAHARAIYTSKGRSAEQREAEALLACRREYEDWQLLELTCKTAREGLHNLRAKGSYLQTVNRSVNEALRGAR